MRKFIILLVVLGLAFMTTSALATGLGPNELNNGNFITGTLTGWSTLNDHNPFVVYTNSNPPPTYVAGAQFHTETELGIYQIIDESQKPGWLPNGTAKQWRVDLDVAAYKLAGGELHVLYYPTNPGTEPALTEVDDAFPGWNVLVDVGYDSIQSLTHYTYSGTVNGFQPRWIAYVLELSVDQHPYTNAYVVFANNDFEAKCVPLPPSVWLMGSGLVGLLGLRRKFGK
jgi:hypothetical protein